MGNCLLLGNGINRCCDGMSWEDLLAKIARSYFVSEDTMKSPALAFEQLCSAVLSRNIVASRDSFAIDTLRELDEINQAKFNDIFGKFKSLPFENILTTNFDYAIERAYIEDSEHNSYTQNVFMSQETKHSNKRHTKIDGKTNVFHIHGELDKPNTICLGYVHYVENLNSIMHKLLDYDKASDDYRIKAEVFGNELISWAQFFFTENIYIVGLGLYDCDMDLWWLIVYRHQLITSGDARVNNKIIYYYLYKEVQQSFKDCLKAMGIEVRELQITESKWDENYIEIAENMKIQIGEAN